jgi:hypothetical protein
LKDGASGLSVERAGRDDVFDGLHGGPAEAIRGEVGAESRRIRAYEGVAGDEPDEGREDRSFVGLRALDYGCKLAVRCGGEGDVGLGAAVDVLPACGPGVDCWGFGCMSLVIDVRGGCMEEDAEWQCP